MSQTPVNMPDDPAVLKAMIAVLQAENAKMSATLRAHDLLVQALRVRIAKLKKQKFGASSEKIEREIEQLELALEDLMVATAEADDTPPRRTRPWNRDRRRPRRPRPHPRKNNAAGRASRRTRRANGVNWTPATPVPIVAAICASCQRHAFGMTARMSASCST